MSHQACLAAKRLCRRQEKPFVPLRTGGGTCFLRAVDAWRRAREVTPYGIDEAVRSPRTSL